MRTNMFSKSFKSLFFLLLFVGFSSFAQAPAPVNIALKKPATQSSDVGGAAGRANDGNSNPNWNGNSINHTNNGPNEFWMVNLQGNFAIAGIKITNRADCCTERIVGATVQVLDNADQVKWSAPITAVAPVYQFAVPSGIVGGFVRVLNKPGQYLSMAEVEVFGVAAAPVAAVPTPMAGVKCADENGTCALTGPSTVMYGKNNTWVTRNATAPGIACNNATFGDPLYGTFKECRIVGASAGTPGNIAPPNAPTAPVVR